MGRKEIGVITPYSFQILRRTHTVKEIAFLMGYTESGLNRWCSRNGIDTSRITDWEVAEEIKYKTPKEIAFEYNVNLKSVYWRLKKLGISPKLQRGVK